MAVPKKKMSRSRTRRRKSQWKLDRPDAVACAQCGEPKRPHRACPNCGIYRGREFPSAVTEE
ncbi:MAG: 50S ribosomal protein L32 [Acidimicrobiia bacterium]